MTTPILNPFNPNSIVTPTLFAGRKRQMLSVLKKLVGVKQGQHSSFILHGERGIGKTALAKLIRHAVSSKDPDFFNLNFATSYYSAEKGQTLQSIMEASLNNITDKLHDSSLKKLSDRLGGVFENGKFSFGAFGTKIKMDLTKNQQIRQTFKDQMISSLTNLVQSSIGQKSNSKFDGMLFAIDEIHNIKDLMEMGHILRSIINTLDVNEKSFFSFLLIGYSNSIDVLCKNDPSVRRSFDLIHLDVMPDDEAKDLLTKGFNKIPKLKYDVASLNQYAPIAGGYPHSLQVLGHHLIEVDTDLHVSHKDWEKAVAISAKELQTKDFSNFYSFEGKQTLREEILNHLALSNGVMIKKTNLSKIFKGKNIYQKNALPLLIQKGAVKENPHTGQLSLYSELFKSAIRFHLESLKTPA